MKVRRIDFYPDDWIAGTIQLDHLERSVYISIIAAIYAHGGPVPLDYVKKICPGRGFARGLAGLLRCSKVSLAGGFLSQSRALTELERSSSRADKWRENGAKGGRPNGLAEPTGSREPRARTRDNHHSSSINHHSSLKEDSKNGKWKKAGHVIPRHNLAHAAGGGPPCQCAACEACTCVECVESRRAYIEKRAARLAEPTADSA